ncbi:MarR family winged helix-turn-helix transcriptional regulator [Microbacterium sp. G2-8]|uniref:MarR family winged helix-turn-helix transcriptional regulator n=1 Tax=Microbacterium sp. G2-8 TaxID=2842454 RepID=UPI001C8A6D27|nr:MarR family transcriptional regulator [Microbacterium sp. G2-8]
MVDHKLSRMNARHASIDPDLVDVAELAESDIAQTFEVMDALAEWQEASRLLAEISARYMRLNETDMRAIRMIMRAQQRGEIVTPKDIARDVGISSASTTKLVDRLVDGGHLTRTAHPSDRRTTRIRVTESTRRSARATVGRQHARRFAAASAMTSDERDTLIRFFEAMTRADAPQGDLVDPSDGAAH